MVQKIVVAADFAIFIGLIAIAASSMSATVKIWTGVLVFVIAIMAGVACAQTLMDIGAARPTPGPNDISQLFTNGNQRLTGSFNYYTDTASPPGPPQRFLVPNRFGSGHFSRNLRR
jgi:hypothetical protein